MADDDFRYRIGDQIYNYDELRTLTEAEVADLPPGTWRDGVFNVKNYIIEAMQVGITEMVEEVD